MSDLTENEESDNPLIKINTLELYAKMKKIDISDYSKEDLIAMLELAASNLSSQTGVDILPVTRSDLLINPTFDSQYYMLGHYPVEKIEEILVNNIAISENDYTLDKNLGIIYFNKVPSGEKVEIKYISKISDSYFESNMKTLLMDVLLYDLDDSFNKGATSVKEGDVSINYDTTTSLGATIVKRIEDIRNNFIRAAIL